MYIASVYTEGVMIAIICEALTLFLSDTSSHRVVLGPVTALSHSESVCVRKGVELRAH